jgi:hypothetical protein
MLSIQSMILGGLVYYINPLQIFVICCYFFKYKYYFIMEDKETTQNIIKILSTDILSFCTKVAHGKEIKSGFFVNKKCIGYIDNMTYEDPKIYIITHSDYYKKITEHKEETMMSPVIFTLQNPVETTKIEMLIRSGIYKNFYYRTHRLDVLHLTPLGDQISIIEKIVQLYNEKCRATIFIDGVSHAGKSSIGYLVAKQLGGKYCHTFNPTDPGDQMSMLVLDAEIDDKPLVVVLEEVDIMIQNIHTQNLFHNKEIPTAVHNKTTWTSFLDDMFIYRKVILIMTSNTSKKEIDQMDVAYLREGRVHASFTMPNVLPVCH